MPADRMTRKALEVGRAEAREVLKLRSAALRSRSRATRAVRARTRARPAAAAADAARVRAAGDPATAGVLVAEGDSWFDYPLNDVLRMLEDDHAYDVESVAHKGDRVEEMAYGRGQLEELTRRLEKLLRRGVVPKAILLSGGGNDVAGDEFGMLLNHSRSAIRGAQRAGRRRRHRRAGQVRLPHDTQRHHSRVRGPDRPAPADPGARL